MSLSPILRKHQKPLGGVTAMSALASSRIEKAYGKSEWKGRMVGRGLSLTVWQAQTRANILTSAVKLSSVPLHATSWATRNARRGLERMWSGSPRFLQPGEEWVAQTREATSAESRRAEFDGVRRLGSGGGSDVVASQLVGACEDVEHPSKYEGKL
jgi:hypothetical protein